MGRDIDEVLKSWEHKPDQVQARLVKAEDGRSVIQVRIELGLLQIETTGRPDGTRPHGHDTYLEYLRSKERSARKGNREFSLTPEQCEAADREFLQYYHRRVAWLALRSFGRAVADADHTLAFMDFVRDHSPSEEFTAAHEQYRGFVLFHRTQAAAARKAERGQPEEAINELRAGLEKLKGFYEEHGADERMEDEGMVKQLRRLESDLRSEFKIGSTLEEQLQEAIAKEQYELAAKLRDEMRTRGA